MWAVLIPIKRLADAKTRLRAAGRVRPGHSHADLVTALALDTVRAVTACRLVADVVAVTDDPRLAAAVRQFGARVIPDRPAAGLNPALTAAARPLAGRPVAALTADLPALRDTELAAALAAVGSDRPGFVPDAAGSGTTLLAAPAGTMLRPRFGAGSAARHAAAGARRLVGDWPGLRRDVDTTADLAEAAGLGLGPATAALYRPARWSALVYGADMQGTVAEFDPDTRSGRLLLDDGRQLDFGAGAFAGSGLRLLRLGQRVQVEAEGERVSRLTLPTMPAP